LRARFQPSEVQFSPTKSVNDRTPQIIHGERAKGPFGFTESLKKAATEKDEKHQPTLF
jgi:hypothetical protein